MRIGELSRRTGASRRSLRLYESKGLIRAARSANGYRDYPPAAIERVQFIQELLTCGFSTREIREFLPCFEEPGSDPSCATGRERYLRKLSQVETLIVALQARREKLLERVAHLKPAVSRPRLRKRKTPPDLRPPSGVGSL
jgi:MerR family transcriptional regulator, copper efflux regulator